MEPLSEDEENYIRLSLLLKGLCPRAVRIFFDKEFPPSLLPSTLKNNKILYDLKFKRVLNQAQWNILFPKNGMCLCLQIARRSAKNIPNLSLNHQAYHYKSIDFT